MERLICLHDYKAVIGRHISMDLLTPDMKRLADEMIEMARKSKVADSGDLWETCGLLTGYELIAPQNITTAGYCNMWRKEIAVANDMHIQEKQFVLCHEMGHAIQEKAGHYDSITYLLSDLIRDEQQAETMCSYLQKALFPNIRTLPQTHLYGFRMKDAVYFNQYFAGWVENDFYAEIKE